MYKTRQLLIFSALVVLACLTLCLTTVVVLAQAPAFTNVPPADLGSAPSLSPDGLQGFLTSLITNHPWFATVIIAIGGLRLVLKPIMLAIEWYTKQTPNPNDDVAVLKFEAGPIYKVLSIGLDILGSVKLPTLVPPRSSSGK